MSERICSIPGCSRDVLARGWCRKHYRNWASTGDPLKNLTQLKSEAPKPACSIGGCDRSAHALGMCKKHYERQRVGGSALLTRTQMRMAAAPTTCSVEGCDRSIKARGWCQAHYFRWRRNGDVGGPDLLLKGQPKEPCHVEECVKPVECVGLCDRHYYRYRKWGDPYYAEEKPRVGAFNGWWRGDDCGYGGAHDRVTRAWGAPASEWPCADCGRPAAHWSYDHCDADEKSGTIDGFTLPYSLKTDHYQPRCVPCHKAFDLAAGQAQPSRTFV